MDKFYLSLGEPATQFVVRHDLFPIPLSNPIILDMILFSAAIPGDWIGTQKCLKQN